MSGTFTKQRVARKLRWCGSCADPIHTGESYFHHTIAPDNDILGNGQWARTDECSDCATRYRRPLFTEQQIRDMEAELFRTKAVRRIPARTAALDALIKRRQAEAEEADR